MNKTPPMIYQAARTFSDPGTCELLLKKARWPDGKVICPNCGSTHVDSITNRKLLRCKNCRKQFSLKQGTLFEDSPLELGQWLLCLFALLYSPQKLTCQQLSKLLGVSLKTAWRMRGKLIVGLSFLEAQNEFPIILKELLLVPKDQIESALKSKKSGFCLKFKKFHNF